MNAIHIQGLPSINEQILAAIRCAQELANEANMEERVRRGAMLRLTRVQKAMNAIRETLRNNPHGLNVKQLAQRTGLREHSVRPAVKELFDSGILSAVGGKYTGRLYRMNRS